MSAIVQKYTYPRSCPQANDIKVFINGEEHFVYRTVLADFCVFSFEGEIDISIQAEQPIKQAEIKPYSLNLVPIVVGNTANLSLNKPVNVHMDIQGRRPIYLYGNPLEQNVPAENQAGVHYFKAGQVYEVGQLNLKDGETLYIEGGAVVKGCVESFYAKNIRICGRGILDGSYYGAREKRRSIRLRQSKHIEIEGIVMVEPSIWMILLWGCEDVHVHNIKQLGVVISSDGIDIVSTKNVLIENCSLRNNDDCVVIKAFPDPEVQDGEGISWDVENVLVKNCVLINDASGNAIEIGHELRTDHVRNIVFENCDILSVHGYGAAFSIHNADRALVSDIRFENIRVEHYYDKLVDFRVIKSKWGKDQERGQVRNVTVKDIDVMVSEHNSGYSISLIGGYDPEHTVENVCFENFRMNGVKTTSPDELDIHFKNAKNVTFR